MTDLRDHGQEPAEGSEDAFKPLSREQAEALRAKHPPISPWRMVMAQAVAGLVVAGVVWLVTGRGGAVVSALYGAAAVVVPGALFVRGMTSRLSRASPGAAVFGFLIWELLKIAVAVAMLVAAARVIPDLSWPALLVAMVVCLKVNWLALLWRGRVKN
jgi:ATP synthase protein I